MTFVQRVLEAMTNHRTKTPMNCYFDKGFSFSPLCCDIEEQWFLSIELSLFFMIRKAKLERGKFSSIEVPLTKEENKALIKAYDVWFKEEKARFQQRQQRARD